MNFPIFISKFYCQDCDLKWRYFDEEYFNTDVCPGNQCGLTLDVNEIQEINDNIYDQKCFGYFECYRCQHTWTSSQTWVLYSQKCKNCDTENNPYKMTELVASGDVYG